MNLQCLDVGFLSSIALLSTGKLREGGEVGSSRAGAYDMAEVK